MTIGTAILTLKEPAWAQMSAPEARLPWAGSLIFGAMPEWVAEEVAGNMVYLATPYSKEVVNAFGKWNRWQSLEASDRAAREMARLCAAGVTAVSPIHAAHAICDAAPSIDPLDERFWARWCQPILQASRAVVIPEIAGWDRSVGVWREAVWALRNFRQVYVYAQEGSA